MAYKVESGGPQSEHRFIAGNDLIRALVESGVVPATVRRVVIDAQVSKVAVIHVELMGDKRLLDIVPVLSAGVVQITRELSTDSPAERAYAAYCYVASGFAGNDGWRGAWAVISPQEKAKWVAAAEAYL